MHINNNLIIDMGKLRNSQDHLFFPSPMSMGHSIGIVVVINSKTLMLGQEPSLNTEK